jgi:phosphomannomutase
LSVSARCGARRDVVIPGVCAEFGFAADPDADILAATRRGKGVPVRVPTDNGGRS